MKARFISEVNPAVRKLPETMKLTDEDMGALLIRTDKIFAGLAFQQFKTEGAIGGKAWPALSSAYAKQKARTHPGKRIMHRTGALRKSLINRNDPGHIKETTRRPKATITLGTKHFIAAFHIPGFLKNKKLPDRDVMQHTKHQEEKYYRAIAEYMATVKMPRVMKKMLEWRRGRRRGTA